MKRTRWTCPLGEQMDTSDQASVGVDESDVSPRRMRTNEEKRRIVEEALVPGASVAAVARRHGVNANLLFGWRRLHKQGLLERSREPAAPLLPVQVTTPTVVTEHRGGAVTRSSSRLRRRPVAPPRSSATSRSSCRAARMCGFTVALSPVRWPRC